MRIAILTNEYPPHIYGGAGVHVEYLTRELARVEDGNHSLEILCFGDQQVERGERQGPGGPSRSYKLPYQDPRHAKFQDTMLRNLEMAGMLLGRGRRGPLPHLVYPPGGLPGQAAHRGEAGPDHALAGAPSPVEGRAARHRLQRASSWVEKTAYENADGVIAVSASMRDDVQELYGVPRDKIRVIHNGIDLNQYRPTPDPSVLARYAIDPDTPFVLFVGRITRQKGIIHLVEAIKSIRPGVQVVLCAGAPDTPEIGREMAERVERARGRELGQPDRLDSRDRPQGRDHRPLHPRQPVRLPVGLRAVRDHQPGGDGLRDAGGRLGRRGDHRGRRPRQDRPPRPRRRRGGADFEPRDPAQFARDFAEAINRLLDDPERLKEMGARSRERVEHFFSWTSIARWTMDFYWDLVQA